MAPGPSTSKRVHACLLLCALLAFATLPAAARQPAMMDANGGGASTCPLSPESDAETDPVRPDKRTTAPAPARNTPARRGGETEAATRPPRWHSFLPGMIR